MIYGRMQVEEDWCVLGWLCGIKARALIINVLLRRGRQ